MIPDKTTVDATVLRMATNYTAQSGFLTKLAPANDAARAPRTATEARIRFNTGTLKAPFSVATAQLLKEAGCLPKD